MKISSRKRALAGIVMLAGFLVLVVLLVLTYRFTLDAEGMPGILEPLVVYHMEFMVFTAIMGLVMGAGVFYLLSAEVEVQRKSASVTGALLLKSLEPSERAIVSALAKHRGSLYQAQLSRLEGFTRLKAHRTLLRLQEKELVNVQSMGKANLVSLSHELAEALDGEKQ